MSVDHKQHWTLGSNVLSRVDPHVNRFTIYISLVNIILLSIKISLFPTPPNKVSSPSTHCTQIGKCFMFLTITAVALWSLINSITPSA